jgi:hypothetical protein
MRAPPLLPEETFARVVRMANFDGTSVLLLGGMFALLTALGGEKPFAIVGLLAAGAGALELHGVSLLRAGDRRGMTWIIASQPLLFVVILGYCVLRLTHFSLPDMPDSVRAMTALSAENLGLSVEDYLRRINQLTLAVLALAALGYQGGMTIYFLRRRAPVERALAESDAPPADE